MDIKEDFIVLQTKEEGLVFFQSHHIKSVGEITDSKGNNLGYKPRRIKSQNFKALMNNLVGQRIQVNLGGPEKVVGLLRDCGDDHLVLLVNGKKGESKKEKSKKGKGKSNRTEFYKEILVVPSFHIVTLSIAKKEDSKKGESKDKKKK